MSHYFTILQFTYLKPCFINDGIVIKSDSILRQKYSDIFQFSDDIEKNIYRSIKLEWFTVRAMFMLHFALVKHNWYLKMAVVMKRKCHCVCIYSN